LKIYAFDSGTVMGRLRVPVTELFGTEITALYAAPRFGICTDIVQIDCASSVVPQVVDISPPIELVIAPSITGTVPLFVTITVCGMPTSVKVNEEGESVSGPPVPAIPMPVRVTVGPD
jgi:hypothetical protein